VTVLLQDCFYKKLKKIIIQDWTWSGYLKSNNKKEKITTDNQQHLPKKSWEEYLGRKN